MAVVGIEIVRERGPWLLPCYSTRGATVPLVLFTDWIVAVARAAGALETPAAGLCPRPAREKGFPSNLLLRLIHLLSLYREVYLTP